ncbi:uncharacterized protein LOC134835144 [Culicoides brevitarsis]|uniref:uncharacterized protein LOC134835144 n=1 Tax=Culicoides brevitarsis TaxID=469753 RepID=UPI00307C22FA
MVFAFIENLPYSNRITGCVNLRTGCLIALTVSLVLRTVIYLCYFFDATSFVYDFLLAPPLPWTNARLTLEMFLDLVGLTADVSLLMGCLNRDVKHLEFFSLLMVTVISCYLLYYITVFLLCQAFIVVVVAVIILGTKVYYFLCGHSLNQTWKLGVTDNNRV